MRLRKTAAALRPPGFAAAVLFWGLSACATEQPDEPDVVFTPREIADIRRLSPLPPLPPDPTNRVAGDPAAARLGQRLFFDERFSGDGKQSCATCHKPELYFADDQPLSRGIGETARNTPSVVNAAYNRWFFWDGRADSLWAQALGPLENPLEMGGSRLQFAHVLNDDADLRAAYESVFGSLPDLTGLPAAGRPATGAVDSLAAAWNSLSAEKQVAVNTVFANIGKALAAYERRLATPGAPFDRFVEGLVADDAEKQAAISNDAKKGLRVFVGKGNCILCHAGPLFSDLEFHNLALGERAWLTPGSLAREEGAQLVLADPFNGDGRYSDAPSSPATEKLRLLEASALQAGRYKTPGLRNTARTAPYMHGGHFATLEEVVRFYALLEEKPRQPVGHRDILLLPLFLTNEDVRVLVAFLETLTGDIPQELTQRPKP